MRYTVNKSVIDVLGEIWMPYGAKCAMRKDLSDYDLRNIRGRGNGRITRRACEEWLALNSGDFSRVIDFRVDISEPGKKTIVYDWERGEESECDFSDCMYPSED